MTAFRYHKDSGLEQQNVHARADFMIGVTGLSEMQEGMAGEIARYGELTSAAAAVVLPPEFCYRTLTVADATALREAAERIRQRVKRQIEDIVHIGCDLIAVKAALQHGQFSKWLAAEFSWTERTARNYMNVAVAFRGRTEIIADLRPSHLYRLAAPSTPAEARETIIAIAESGQPVTDTLVTETIQQARMRHTAKAQEPRAAARPDSCAGTAEPAEVESKASSLVALITARFGDDQAILREAVAGLAPEAWIRARDLLMARKP
jgi:hypothetical protein